MQPVWDSCSVIPPVVGPYFTTGATGLLGFSYGITPAACSYVTTGATGSGLYVLDHALVGLGGRLPAPPALQVLPENHAVARDPDQRCSAGLAAGAGTKGSSGSRSGNGSSRPMAFPSLPLKGSQDTPLNRRPKTLRSVTNVRNWRPPKCPALNWNRCEGALAPKWLSPKKGILGKISNHPGHN